jgi:hypothetical protein
MSTTVHHSVRHSLAPTASQLAAYTGNRVVPDIRLVEFRTGIPGDRVERCESLDGVRDVLRDRQSLVYQDVQIRFYGSREVWRGRVEKVAEKTMLVVPDDRGDLIVTSVSAEL